MSAADPVTSPTSTNTWINGLKWGKHWDTPGTGPTTIYYAFGTGAVDFGGTTVTGLTPLAAERAALASILASISNVINVTFVETTNLAQADIVCASVREADAPGLLGSSTPPGEYFKASINDWQSSIIVNRDAYTVDGSGNPTALNPGGFDYAVWLHEIGHALGLAHPHDNGGTSTIFPGVTAEFDDYGDFNMNQGIYTVMSYNPGWVYGSGAHGASPSQNYGYQAGIMALDIASLQLMYGANPTHSSGNTNYYVDGANGVGTGYTCIWDAGGVDTIIAANSQPTRIDLRSATLGLDDNGSGFGSYTIRGITPVYASLLIANGVVIENARGGASYDVLIGNSSDNILNGLGSVDYMEGHEGNDLYYVDDWSERATEYLDEGVDSVRSSVTYRLGDHIEKLYLVGTAEQGAGNNLSNFIFGNALDNVLNGDLGADRLYGNGGNDTYYVDSPGDLVFETIAGESGGNADFVSSATNFILPANVENLELVASTNINGTGNNLSNVITGNSFANVLDGQARADTLRGGLGKDSFAFSTSLGVSNVDWLPDFSVADDTIRLDDSIFSGLPVGYLRATALVIGAAAMDALDRIVYNNATGALFFDADGTGAIAAKQFATLSAGLALTNADFYVF